MNQADLLTAAFRKLASAKAGMKGGLGGALHAKDGKEKAEHFREQMQKVSKDRSTVIPKVDKNVANVAIPASPLLDAAAILAELTGETKPKPIDGERTEKDEEAPKTAGDGKQTVATTSEWHDPNAALSAVMSKIGQAQQNSGSDDEAAPQLAAPQVDLKAADATPDLTDADIPAVETPPEKRFTASVETTDTKPIVMTKAVVREQETHFEPVQQVTTLQKIVDRMASDLPAVAAPEAAHAAEAPVSEADKPSESRPVRMMTLELDPPNLGSVTVKMRLAGGSVEVHLTADRLETTQLLRQERGVLSDAMQSAGYSFDISAIEHARMPDGNMSNGQSQSQPQSQQQSADQRGSMPASNGAQSDGSSSGRSSGDAHGGARQNRQDHDQSPIQSERPQNPGGSGVRSSTVYL